MSVACLLFFHFRTSVVRLSSIFSYFSLIFLLYLLEFVLFVMLFEVDGKFGFSLLKAISSFNVSMKKGWVRAI